MLDIHFYKFRLNSTVKLKNSLLSM